MNYLLKIVSGITGLSLFFTLGLGNIIEANAKSVPVVKFTRAQRGSAIKDFVESVHSPAQVLLFGTGLGLSKDTLKAIQTDLNERTKENNFPRISLSRTGEVTLDGERTGIQVSTQGVGSVSYLGHTWSYDKNASIDSNYLALKKLLSSSSKSASITEFFIPSAHAMERGTAQVLGAAGGIAVSVLAGIIASATIALALPEIVTALFGLLALNAIVNGMVGKGIGEAIYDKKVIQKTLENIQSADSIDVMCDLNSSILRIKMKDGSTKSIEFLSSTQQANGRHEYGRILDEKDGHVTNIARMEIKNALYQQMRSCKNAEDASAVAGKLQETLAKAKEVLVTSRGGPISEEQKADTSSNSAN